MQNNEQKKVLAALLSYAQSNHKSLAAVARQLGITQNTISNWKKGSSISIRNQDRIMQLVANGVRPETCDTSCCSCRDTKNPILASMLSVLAELPERDIAKLYAFALELRDVPVQYRYGNNPAAQAAEEKAPFKLL